MPLACLYFRSLADVGTAVNKLTMPSLLIKYRFLLFEKSQDFSFYYGIEQKLLFNSLL